MKTDTPRPIRLKDYRPPDYLIDEVHLDFRLAPESTRVQSSLRLRPNPKAASPGAPLVLDGETLELKALRLNGVPLAQGEYVLGAESLTIAHVPGEPFTLEIETICNPAANTALSGLYRSSGNYCTQCEAEGFRRITYFLDRPDVLAVYTTRIEAGRSEAPVLLSNGNMIEHGPVAGTERHFAVWHDPHPKPSYLFALVSGTLGCVEDGFITASGREVALRIYVEPGNEDRCDYAMDALKRSMKWDEEVFGREYDLDIFMIVAVSDFNMGAMENKGLNVFNDKYILALPDTATDADYANIEAIIAHEYFHNWTGNRITCRDWFQLCLKEGLTVFRDQEFSSDMRSRAVKRIADVIRLRSEQFPEDAGPLAHPVRPESYIEINNFYTATVYEKGAEIVRMMSVLLGPGRFRAAMDLYFERHDGQAATVEDFVRCMEDASGLDLGQFRRWYSQAGTPEITVSSRYSPAKKALDLSVTQLCAPSPGQRKKDPYHFPLAIGLIDPAGKDMAPRLDGAGLTPVIEVREREQRFRFVDVPERPVLSINRGFSSPVRVNAGLREADLLFLMTHDRDPFNRWEAGQNYATSVLIAMVEAIRAGQAPRKGARLAEALAHSLADRDLDPAFVALMITLPGEADLAREIAHDVDPGAIHQAREHLRRAIATQLREPLARAYADFATPGPYSPDAASAGRRALRNTALAYLALLDDGPALAAAHFDSARNMTDSMASLSTLARIDCPERQAALDAFYAAACGNHLVVDKWLALNAMAPLPSSIADIRALMDHPAFSLANPNKVRALIGTFASSNAVTFNRPDGEGYRLLADVVLSIDGKNPQLAARLAGGFKSWRVLEAVRKSRAETELKRIAATDGLSRDTYEIVSKTLH
jgi:aminopeptidase N